MDVRRTGRLILVVTIVATLSGMASPLVAQDRGTIKGRIVEESSGRPLNAVRVSVVDTRLAAVTDPSGQFHLVNVPIGDHILEARLLGFKEKRASVRVVANEVTRTEIALEQAAITLDEIVVTGTAGATNKRRLGNAITSVNADQLTEKRAVTSVGQLLQAEAPGLTILSGSGTPGSAELLQIRGASSLSAGNEPVVYVDGVRIYSGAAGNFENSWVSPSAGNGGYGGGQSASALGSINPEDIKSVEIIKGPAAATLYGADAANGVINIITKNGTRGEQDLQWTAKVQMGQTDWALDRRTNYTTCTSDLIAATLPSGAPAYPGCQGVSEGTVLTFSGLDQPGVLRTGDFRNYSVGVRGGGQEYSFFAMIDRDAEQGVQLNSASERSSARANFAFFPSEYLDFGVNFGYSRNEVQFPQGDNAENLLLSAWLAQPGAAPLPGQEVEGFSRGSPAQFARNYENIIGGNRAIFGTTVNYRPYTWLTNRLTIGGDFSSRQANRYVAPGSPWPPTSGQQTEGTPRNTVYTVDYSGTIQNNLTTDISSTLSFGTQYIAERFQNTVAQGTGFPFGAARDVSLAANRFSWTEFSESKSLGFYLQEQVGWRNRLFVTSAVRVDNHSVFGEDVDLLLYPKVAASYLISEEPSFGDFGGLLDQLKLRVAWGQAGNAPGPFAAARSYTIVPNVDNETGELVSALRLNTIGNPEIEPERGTELEAGFDAAFFSNRLGVEFTFYNQNTRNALVSVPIPPSTGFLGGYLANIGEVKNRGIEVSVNATPVQMRGLTWTTRLGYSTNHNELASFGDERGPVVFGVSTRNQRHAVGYPLGGYWVHDPILQPDGSVQAGEARYLGPSRPTREASFSNSVTIFNNVSVSALLDYKGGFYLLNQTENSRCRARVCERVNRPGVTAEEITLLTASLSRNDALYTQRADFIKLRDVSLSYTLPNKWAQSLGGEEATVTVSGHNLGVWTEYGGIDPEINAAGVSSIGVRRDSWTMPMTRRLTAALRFTF